MLVDVDFHVNPASHTVKALNVVSILNKGSTLPKRIEKGLYVAGHWSINQILREVWDKYPKIEDFPERGVCDSLEQFKEAVGDKLHDPDRKFIVCFVKIVRADQDSFGGWRWSKWGPYIGKHSPQKEYIYDEVGIEVVYTYQIYEKRELRSV